MGRKYFHTCLFIHPSIHHSVCPQGGTPARSSGGYPQPGGTLLVGSPLGGTPPWVPLIRPGQGVPCQVNRGGCTPPRVTDGVLETPRSVCLFRSRRRTFLLLTKVRSRNQGIYENKSRGHMVMHKRYVWGKSFLLCPTYFMKNSTVKFNLPCMLCLFFVFVQLSTRP